MSITHSSLAATSHPKTTQTPGRNQADTPPSLPGLPGSNDVFQKRSVHPGPRFGCFGWFRRADRNAKDSNGQTAVIRATLRCDAEKVAKLVAKGADVSLVDNQGHFPLKLAVLNNDKKTVRALLASTTVDINQRDPHKNTVLMTAATLGYDDMVEFLLEQGADPTLYNSADKTAAEQAARTKGEARLLLKNDALEARCGRIITLLTPAGQQQPLIPVPSTYKGELVTRADGSCVFRF